MGDRPKHVLYRLKADWGLPSSLSIACLQAEAYLRLANIQFAVQDCPWGSYSPTGQVPALDTAGGDLVGADNPDSIASEFEGAKAIISHLQRLPLTNLDAQFSPAVRGDIQAFTTLLETKLIPALLYTTWCESEAYSKLTRKAMGSGLPFPLNYWLPHATRKEMRTQFTDTSADEIYAGASAVIDAVAAKLVHAAPDGFFLSDKPSSLDALLFACLAYIRSAPVVHPDLRKKFDSYAVLGRYVDRVASRAFSLAVPYAAQADLQWSSWGSTSGAGPNSSNKPATGLNRNGKLWLMGAGVAIVGYILLSGQYFDVSYGYLGDLGEDDDDEYED